MGLATAIDATQYAKRLNEVRALMDEAAAKSGRSPESVALVAVSKKHPAEAVAAMAEAGQTVFGESYVQEALAKREELARLPLRWHFVGGLQSKKAKYAAGAFALIHSVDNEKLAGLLDKKACSLGLVQDVLIQVNLAREEQKGGASREDCLDLAERILEMDGLNLRGLMVMPPYDPDAEKSRPYFAGLRKLRGELEQKLGLGLPELSMGMTGDFIQAIEEGATLVRIGTRLFGPRPGACVR